MCIDGEFPPESGGGDFSNDEAVSPYGKGDAEVFEGLDALGHVVEVADLMSSFAAQRFVSIDAMRRGALADGARYGGIVEIAERSVRLELASALRVGENAAAVLIMQAEALCRRYPSVLASLARAGITERHAEVLVDAIDTLEPELRDDVLPRALVLAEAQPIGWFRRSMRKLVDTARSVTLTQRHEAALQGRRVLIVPAEDGMAWVSAYVPAVEAHAIHGRLTGIGKVLARQEGETRTLDQVRADVFGDLLIDGTTHSHPPQARGIRATVAVTVPVLSLLDDDAARAEPATVEGIGPVPIGRARELCGGSGEWMRVLTHPETGIVLSVGRDKYRPPKPLRRLVRWRAERCLAPGCGMPASRCQIDHNIPFEEGGRTELSNLTPFCQGHHTVKHHGGWKVTQLDGSGGTIEWISPAGRRYLVEPERRVPVFTPTPPEDDPPPF